ncbi:hypothetical protein ABL78_1724 [Leptomonas seymouri]|uniref:Ankyrin repeat protein n=1 Tax=Leptomonas seymouri TaxID=5684 RepID=A0A0N1I1T0_LEPSE|nr:hypothetical protein ABL78_1724 [Leptomonas seymouri]|eukprot:KPI89161.1 hypothetical protein ABL78_1724 [Leptomonas seymouri]
MENDSETRRDAAAVALDALRDVQLLDSASDAGVLNLLRNLSAFLGTASAEPRLHNKTGPGAGGTSTSPVLAEGSDGNFAKARNGDVVALGALPPPPAFLHGGLKRLRLLLAARNGTLQYESYQQDTQWASLLRQTSSQMASWRRMSRGAVGQVAIGQLRDEGLTIEDSNESSFVAALQQGQLDALSPAAACPVRCQVCPTFSTPSLQRVDELSYGPLRSTTTAAAGATSSEQELAMDEEAMVLSEGGEYHDSADETPAMASPSSDSASLFREKNRGSNRPVRALLLRADMAIESAPDAWYAYWCTAAPVKAPTTANGGEASGCWSPTQGASYDASRTHWRSSSARLQTKRPSRYSASYAIEEYLQVAQAARQRRARRTPYSTMMKTGTTDDAKDEVASDEEREDERTAPDSYLSSRFMLPSSTCGYNNFSSTMCRTDRRSPRSIYFEVHLSLSYLLALQGTVSTCSLAAAAATKRSVSSNSVVVGLCDEELAATANGCTHGPQHYRSTHLGHTCGPARLKTAQRGATAAPQVSAGVSVSVVARYTASAASTTSCDESSVTEVVLLAVWQHKDNSIIPVTSEQGTPVYLRMEVPRYSTVKAAAAAAAPTRLDCDVTEEEDIAGVLSDVDSGEAARQSTLAQATHAPPTTTFLPTLTLVSLKDAGEAIVKTQQGDAAPNVVPSLLDICPATVVFGLLYTPSSDSLRFRLNNYVHPGELNFGMVAAPAADSHSISSSDLPARLYPATTLSLDEHGWERWYNYQTMMWARARQRRPGVSAQGSTGNASAKAETAAGYNSSLPTQAVSNAVVRFAFEPAHLLYGPPLTVPAPQRAAPRSAAQKREAASHRRPRGELVCLLDTQCKSAQMLNVLTNVAALAGLMSGQRLQQQPDSASSANQHDEVPPGFSEGSLTKSHTAASAAPLFGSRDRRVREVLTYVQKLLNSPAAEGALFYPPVRIYRHSSHCPPKDLYPLPRSSAEDDGEDVMEEGKDHRVRKAGTAAAGAPPSSTPPIRRQLGAGLNLRASLTAATAHLYWHEIIPENIRLTPLCAALASRQPAMAYAICTHPLTSFCDSANEGQQRVQQQQQRRTALYTACALGYADVLAVLLERIPVEEILSYFGLVIEGEARAALQQSYTKAETLFFSNYRLNALSAAACLSSSSQLCNMGSDSSRSGTSPPSSSSAARMYCTNECQRPLLDVFSIYSTSRSLYTPLHVALLGVIRESHIEEESSDSQDEAGDEEQPSLAELLDTAAASPSIAQAMGGLRRQTACATLLLNCLYDLLLVAPSSSAASADGGISPANKAATAAVADSSRPAMPGGRSLPREADHAGTSSGLSGQKHFTAAGAELLASALNLQSRAGETALLLAVRHSNCPVAIRLLKLGAQAACMDRVTHLFTLELACANRCSPIAEALLSGSSSPYATSPVLLNHAGIATALCWCAINNMHAVLQKLLRCESIDVNAGFEGSSPLHLAITFGSVEAALALLNGTQPKTLATTATEVVGRPTSSRPRSNNEGGDNRQARNRVGTGVERNKNLSPHSQANAAPPITQTNGSNVKNGATAHEKPLLDVNIPHERTRCTALHLACERGQLRVIHALLQQWHAQLNIPAANTNYTPLLSALANGREDAALRVLEYSKDELRRGRAVLDLAAIDHNGDTALHLAARRGLVMAMEYMLVQFCDEEVTRLAQLHAQLRNSPAFLSATCIVPLHAVNKQGKSALLVAIQYDQADTAEVLVSTLIDRQGIDGGENGQESNSIKTEETDDGQGPTESNAASVCEIPSFGGALIDGTCMALHQAFKKRLYTVVDLMLSAPSAECLFPVSQAFREAVQQHAERRRDNRALMALIEGVNESGEGDDELARVSPAPRSRVAGQNRSSFVRLLLKRAAGPTVSPSAALHLLLRGFVLPELCVYLSGVAAESTVVGVQNSTAMAYAELLMGYLQEHAGLVVAPTRMVGFCREVWGSLQAWMRAKAAQTQPKHLQRRENKGKARRQNNSVSFSEGLTKARRGTASPSTLLYTHAEMKEHKHEPPMVWLCRVLLPSESTAHREKSHRGSAGGSSTTAAEGGDDTIDSSEGSEEREKEAEEEMKKYGDALRSALNRKSLSLDIARVIRLYGSTAGGARAIEEIESLVRAYVTAKANAQARQMRQRRATPNKKFSLFSRLEFTATSKVSDSDDEKGESEASKATRSTSTSRGNTTSGAAIITASDADVSKEVVGNEVLFTTPVGFTVLQLAAALGLPEVTAFLVEKYKLHPLYAPAQDLHGERNAGPLASDGPFSNELTGVANAAGGTKADGGTRAIEIGSTSSSPFASLNAVVAAAVVATPGREEEEEHLRVINSYTVRAIARLTTPLALVSAGAKSAPTSTTDTASRVSHLPAGNEQHVVEDGESGGSGGAGSKTWFYWTPYRLAIRTGSVDMVRMLLRTTENGEQRGRLSCKGSLTCSLDKQNFKEEEASSAERSSESHAATRHSQIVDFKEPQWADPFQRTALQELIASIAGATSSSASASSSGSGDGSSMAESMRDPTGASALDEHSQSRATSTLAAAEDMVALLLRHGAQPNGLFDSTGCDAWMLALTGSETDGFVHAAAASGGSVKAEGEGEEERDRALPLTVFSGPGVESCLRLLLRFHTPLLGRAPAVAGKSALGQDLADEESSTDAFFNEQLLQHRNTLLHKWKRLACMRDSSSATREKLAAMKRHQMMVEEAASASTDIENTDGVDEGGFVFDAAQALIEAYRTVSQDNIVVLPPHATNAMMDGLSMSSLNHPTLAPFLTFGQTDADVISDNSSGTAVALTSAERAHQPSQLWNDDNNPMCDGAPYVHPAAGANCKGKLIAALRLCYRTVLLYLCVDHAPQQLIRLLQAYTLDVVPVRARHPFSGDTVVTRLLRKARERLLASGSTPTDEEVDNIAARVIEGVNRLDLGKCTAGDNKRNTTSADQPLALSESQQRAYRDPTEDPGASILIHTSLALIHLLPRLDSASPEAHNNAILQSILFHPSFDNETALSFAAYLAYVPLISCIVQSTAPPAMVKEVANAKIDWNSKHNSRSTQRRASREQREAPMQIDEPDAALFATHLTALSSQTHSLSSNLTDVVVRVLLATQVYYPAHEIDTVRILLHCMPDESARLAFLRWVYPNIHPLPALQLAMDNVDVVAHFLTTPDCMNALWTNILYTHFTRQLDTAVHASSKAWNALLKVVLPGAPAVPIYLLLREALRTQREEANGEGLFEWERETASTALTPSSTSGAKRWNQQSAKKKELTNWSYLVRRTAIFLQLMSVSVAETLTGRTSSTPYSGFTAIAARPPSKGGSGSKRSNKASPHDAKDGAEEGAGGAVAATGAAGGAMNPSSTANAPRGLIGTLLLDTLELAVRYDDKDVLSFLMQLRLPEVVIKYVQLTQQQQQQQQQAANASTFPVSVTAQMPNPRAIEAANAAIMANYPSFAGVRSITQASTILERLQRLLWREAIQERHLDLIAVLAGAVRTLRSLFMSHQADVASLLSPMRYDRIDVNTGNPEGVVSTLSLQASGISPRPSPRTEAPGAAASAATSTVEHPNASVVAQSSKRSQNAAALHAVAEVNKEPTPSPPLQPMSSATQHSSAQMEAEEEQRFIEICLQNGRLAAREERRRRVTLVTWGIGGTSRTVDLPASGVVSSSVSVDVVPDAANAVRDAEAKGKEAEQQQLQYPAVLTGGCAPSLSSPALSLLLSLPTSLLSPNPQQLPPVLSIPDCKALDTKSSTRKSFKSVPYSTSNPSSLAVAPAAAAKTTHTVDKTPLRTAGSRATSAGQTQRQQRTRKAATTTSNDKNVTGSQMSSLHLPVAQSSTTTPPPCVENPVYFMYLLLDWAMFSTRLLQSPQPSTATVDTILYLLEHRCALSVPVLDLFLSGLTVTASRFVFDISLHSPALEDEGSTRPRNSTAYNRAGESTQTVTVELSLRYRTRLHRDTLLHLLVLHDQCQLAEYYLEYCYFLFASHQIDPEPKNGKPGRFPIHEQLRQQNLSTYKDSEGERTEGKGRSSTTPFPSTPAAFLRLMLRVNAHGLTAFDYAHSPAMLQLLEWYGCVPPTYRPNPRLFRQVLITSSSSHHRPSDESEAEPPAEVKGWALIEDEEEHKYNNLIDDPDARSGGGAHAANGRKKREILQFFPIPRLVLASDNFVALLDLTGAELASTAPLALTTDDATTAREEMEEKLASRESPKSNMQAQQAERQQLKSNRRLAALIAAEEKQLQLTQRRREQQELAKAMLFEQVAVQPLIAARHGATSNNAKSNGGKVKSSTASAPAPPALASGHGPANPSYLMRAVTASLRERWDAQRHPYVSDNVLWHNALEAQRQSSLPSGAVHFSSSVRKSRDDSYRGGLGGVLPILLSEEVSLLHLGLCAFDDELVSLYGEVHASSSQQHQQQYGDAPGGPSTDGGDEQNAGTGKGGAAAERSAAAAVPQAQLSAYSRMLLPPVLAGKPVQHEPREQQPQTDSLVKDQSQRKGKLGGHDSKGMSGGLVPSTSAVSTTSAAGRKVSASSISSALLPPPPPRLSHADIIFLLECEQFVVFPLALPTAYDDDLPPEGGNRSRSNTVLLGKEDSASLYGTPRSVGRELEAQLSGSTRTGSHAPYDMAAVINRCTGGDSSHADARSKSVAVPSSCASSALQPVFRVRSRAQTQKSVSSDAPLLRALLARQAATMSDLTDVSPHRYDAALLVSLTPMQLSGAAGSGGRGKSTVTMRALAERLTGTQFKQFSSRPVTGPSTSSSSSAHATVETVALLNVPPFVMSEAMMQSTAFHRAAPHSLVQAPCDDSTSPGDAGTTVGTATEATLPATYVAPTNIPTVMAARMEEWVARRWPAQRKLPPKLKQPKKFDIADADMAGVRTPPPSSPLRPLPPRPNEKGENDGKKETDSSLLPLPSVLDRVAPLGGVATASQQMLMRALLKHFSATTGAQLSEQMGLLIAPNYDVETVGDVAAAQRTLAAKNATPARKKRR